VRIRCEPLDVRRVDVVPDAVARAEPRAVEARRFDDWVALDPDCAGLRGLAPGSRGREGAVIPAVVVSRCDDGAGVPHTSQ
jgi:hypothetical protein